MKKNTIMTVIALALVTLLAAGCSNDAQNQVSTRTVRVVGTAVKADTRAIGDKYVIDSVDSVVVDGKDIKDKLVPADPASLTGDKQNNVTFVADVDVKETLSFTAEGKKGYVFDEWEVLEAEGEGKDAKLDKKLLKEIEKWLEKDGREDKETLENVPSRYLPYLVAEYDNGFYVTLAAPTTDEKRDGTSAHPFTVDELLAQEYTEDELTLVIKGEGDEEFARLMAALSKMTGLEELKLKAAGATLTAIPALEKLEEVSLAGFTFTEAIDIDNDKVEWKFSSCTFEKGLTIKNAKEAEIKGGKTTTLTVLAAEELQLEGLTADKIDLSAMKGGEVELENVIGEIVMPLDKSVEVEIDND